MKIETKTQAAGLAAWIGSSVLLMILNGLSDTATVTGLPAWAASILYGVLPGLTAMVAAYQVKHRPGMMSESAVNAVQVRGTASPGSTPNRPGA